MDQWFDSSVFAAVNRFGTLGRNVVGLQIRVDVFDVFNQANFGPPGNLVDGPTFGKITRTRLPTGEAGSSRQIQLAARLSL